MRRLSIAFALVLLFISTVPAAAAPPPSQDYIVVLKDRNDAPAVAREHANKHGLAVGFVYEHALRGYAARLTAAQRADVARDPRVAFVSEDKTLQALGKPVNSVKPSGGETVPTGVLRIGAATATSVHGASTANVAVIDTGIALGHPDLTAVSGKNCLRPTRSAEDDNGHGTHVAGTIAAKNNGSGVVGVAPGTKLYAVKVLDASGSGSTSQVICGIDWVTANAAALNIKVANLSLGGPGSTDASCGSTNADALHVAICRSVAAGVTYVVAAGNSGANLAGSTPAAYPEVLTATGISDADGAPGGTGTITCRSGERDDAYASFSNYALSAGDQAHTLAAPGVCIRSTWLRNGYATLSGTSMAAPHLAGTVALCLTGPCAGLAPAQVIQKLRADAQAHATATNGFAGDPNSPVGGKYFGYLAWAGGY